MDTPIKVIYIIGNGRSGSTILDMLLNSSDDIVGVGQLSSASDDHAQPCSCGNSLEECPLWSKVIALYEEKTQDYGMARIKELEAWFDKNGNLFRVMTGNVNRENYDEYLRLTKAKYEAVREVTGKEVIVDSSKMVIRGVSLKRIPGLDVRFLHLIRHGQGLIWSTIPRQMRESYKPGNWARILPTRKRFMRLTMRWIKVNMTIAFLRTLGFLKKYHFVKYEGLMQQPRETMMKIADFAGVDRATFDHINDDETSLQTAHLISGNPKIIEQGSIRLSPEQHKVWSEAFPSWLSSVHFLVALPVYLRYGYTRRLPK